MGSYTHSAERRKKGSEKLLSHASSYPALDHCITDVCEKDGKKKKNTINNDLRNINSQHLPTARYCPVTDEETMVQRGEVTD